MTSDLKICKVCASEIPSAALKCIKCGSYQDFRRFFDIGNTTLALLIAFISVIGLAHKNISDLYRSVFVDPLQPNVVARRISIEPERLSILFQNNAPNRIVLNDGALCRVPILKSDIEFIDDTSFRYPRPSDISAVQLLVYQNPHEQKIVEGGQLVTAVFLLHQTRPEEGRPFNETALEIKPYCFVRYIDQRGREDGLFVPIDAAGSYFLQKKLAPRGDRKPLN